MAEDFARRMNVNAAQVPGTREAIICAALCQWTRRTAPGTIRTAGSAGGLFCPYKGLLPATSQDVLNEFANRTFFTH